MQYINPFFASHMIFPCVKNETPLSLCVYPSEEKDPQAIEGKSNTQAACEATNKEAFFSRVESYSISFFLILTHYKA